VVDADADLDRAADAVLRGGFYANGQACISVQRVLVCEPVLAAFVDRLLARLGELTVGDPRDPATRVAALINDAATNRRAGLDLGGRGGRGEGALRRPGADRAVEPTVLLDVPEASAAWCEEIFGPVVAIRSVPDLATAAGVGQPVTLRPARQRVHPLAGGAFRAIDELDVGG